MGRRNCRSRISGPKKAVKDLKPQLGPTEALAMDLNQQVDLLRTDYMETAEVLRKVRNVIWQRQQRVRERQRGPERDYGPSRYFSLMGVPTVLVS